MATGFSFGIRIGIGTGAREHKWAREFPSASAGDEVAIYCDDGPSPHSDEKEVVIDDGNRAGKSVWKSTTTTEDIDLTAESNSAATRSTSSSDLNSFDEGCHATSAIKSILPCNRAWRVTKSAVKNASTTTSKYLTISAPNEAGQEDSDVHFTLVSREEFEALPLTIQRKQFSTLERICLAKDLTKTDFRNTITAYSPLPTPPGTARATVTPLEPEGPTHRRPSAPVLGEIESRHRPRLSSVDQDLLTRLPEKVKRRHLSQEEQLLARHQQLIAQHRNLATPEDTDRDRAKRQKQLHQLDLAEILDSNSTSSVIIPLDMPIHEITSIHTGSDDTSGSDFLYNTFRWLEQDENLDLRLCLDDPGHNIVDDSKSAYDSRPSIRRHLSLSTTKLPFTRTSVVPVRPSTNTTVNGRRQLPPPTIHTRSKSRALSLISPNKHQRQGSTVSIDAAAAHYQDPEARMRLRQHLTSPQKFDEVIEFGFPSVGGDKSQPADTMETEERDPLDQLRTWLSDDRSSIYSDKSSIADPESPRTPPIVERAAHPSTFQPYRPFQVPTSLQEESQVPARDMTLRMTLTRPDLRAGDSEIYGWQHNPNVSRTNHIRSESMAPTSNPRNMTPKSSIERRLAALDQENYSSTSDSRPLKRFWNRVRRA